MNWRGWLIRHGWRTVTIQSCVQVTPTFMRCKSHWELVSPWRQLVYVASIPLIRREAQKMSDRIDARTKEVQGSGS